MRTAIPGPLVDINARVISATRNVRCGAMVKFGESNRRGSFLRGYVHGYAEPRKSASFSVAGIGNSGVFVLDITARQRLSFEGFVS